MSEQKTQSRDPDVELRAPPHEPRGGLPAVVERAPPRPQRRWRPRVVVIALLVMTSAGAGIGWLWWHQHQSRLPPGIASGNGRLESDEIDIDTKFAGRIAKLFVEEGDMVAAGQVVAMMDTRDIQASLKKSEALVGQAQRKLDEAKANLAQQQTQVTLAQQQLDRTSALVPKGFATVELLDQRPANHKVAEAQHALDAATQTSNSTGSTSSTILASRLGRGASSTVLPMWAKSSPREAGSLRCSTPRTFTWTSTCRPRMPAGSGSAPRPGSCNTTDIHLPRRIGEAVKRAFHGTLDEHFDEGGYFVRVNWVSDI